MTVQRNHFVALALSALILTLALAAFAAVARAADAPAPPRPEHPMPQVKRAQWLNLNGQWEFDEGNEPDDARHLGASPYPDKITVPFARESKLSGLARRGFVKNVWYRRAFTLPADWNKDGATSRTLLHLGACDWKSRAWLNGQPLGEHEGGNSPATFEITTALKPGENTLIVHAFDDTRGGLQTLGKQSDREESYGIVYTRTTGIWQTVWLEGVGSSYLSDFHIEPDPDRARVELTAEVDGPWQGLTLTAEARAAGKEVARASAPARWRDGRLTLDLADKRLWSPADPFLYDLELTLSRGDRVIDKVQSYFGLRSVTIAGAAILLNGQPVFQRLVLDQGFWPDGVWTAPADAELRADIERAQAAGFNGARLHQKVFEPRYLYWADKLGYLCWGEAPSYGANYTLPAVNRPIMDEWIQIVRRDRNHPAIIGWCPFNETPGEAGALQRTVVRLTRALDPARPVIETSGWAHTMPDPEVLDAHDYDQTPTSFRHRWIDDFQLTQSLPARYGFGGAAAWTPFMVSEMGGIGWEIDPKGADKGSWAYGTPESLEGFYQRFGGLTGALLDSPWLFGLCYTQLTDVEQEHNGLYTFDRKPKFDVKRLHDLLARPAVYEKNPPLTPSAAPPAWRVAVTAQLDGPAAKPWRTTTQQPAEGWNTPEFKDDGWPESFGAFGHKDGWEAQIRTPWTTPDIWLRQAFENDGQPFDQAALVIHWDNDTQVFINGQPVWQGEGWSDRYAGYDVADKVQAALKPGRNVIAVHTHQSGGGQFIDLALLLGRRTQ